MDTLHLFILVMIIQISSHHWEICIFALYVTFENRFLNGTQKFKTWNKVTYKFTHAICTVEFRFFKFCFFYVQIQHDFVNFSCSFPIQWFSEEKLLGVIYSYTARYEYCGPLLTIILLSWVLIVCYCYFRNTL